MSNIKLWVALVASTILILVLGYFLYTKTILSNQMASDLNNLQTTLSSKPKIIKIDSIVYQDRIFNVFKTPKISQNNIAAKILAVGDSRKLDSLNRALNITTKDLLSYREVNASLKLENQKLSQVKDKPGKIEYKDKYITLIVDKNNDMLDTLEHKISILSASYMKAPKWYKGKEENYVISVDDPRVKTNLRGFDPTPKNIKSLVYIDSRYQFDPKTLSNGLLSSTLNLEIGADNIVSFYGGGGVQTNFKQFKGVVNIGAKVNLYRHKK